MESTTFERLQRIRKRFGPGVFGKIAQKLLAIAFFEAGFAHIVERGVQGVDIDAAKPDGPKYAIEVKTTEGDAIVISQENIDAIRSRASDDYVPLVAALRLQMFEDWILANVPLSELRPGALPIARLRAYRMMELETSIRTTFEAVVSQHLEGVLARGEQYLSEVIEASRSERR